MTFVAGERALLCETFFFFARLLLEEIEFVRHHGGHILPLAPLPTNPVGFLRERSRPMILKPKGRLIGVVALLLEPHSAGSRAVYHGIQRLRRQHDPRYDKWLPHITLIPPFEMVSPIPANHGTIWKKDGTVPSNYTWSHQKKKHNVNSPPLALESEATRLEPDYFFRRQAHRFTPPLQNLVRHVSASLREVARDVPGGPFSINLSKADYFALKRYSVHLRPTPVPERSRWDDNRPSSKVDAWLKHETSPAKFKGKDPMTIVPPGLPKDWEKLASGAVSPPAFPEYRAIQGPEGTRRLLLLQHQLHLALAKMGVLAPPDLRKLFKPHLTVGQAPTSKSSLDSLLGPVRDLTNPRPPMEEDVLKTGGSGDDSQSEKQAELPAFPVARIALLVKAQHDPGPYWVFEEYPVARHLPAEKQLPRYASRSNKLAHAKDPDTPRQTLKSLTPMWPEDRLEPDQTGSKLSLAETAVSSETIPMADEVIPPTDEAAIHSDEISHSSDLPPSRDLDPPHQTEVSSTPSHPVKGPS